MTFIRGLDEILTVDQQHGQPLTNCSRAGHVVGGQTVEPLHYLPAMFL